MMVQTQKEIDATKNAWQKKNRVRLLVLATLEESEQIKEQAKKEGLSVTRYLINCHNYHVAQTDKNASITDENNSKGIKFYNDEK